MAAPTNTSALTATVIASLPASIAQRVDDAGTTYDVWYQYEAQSSDVALSVFGFGDLLTYTPDTAVFEGPASAPVSYLSLQTADNKGCYFPVTPGTTYYFKFRANVGNPTPANLSVSVTSHAIAAVPIGSLGVNDDIDGFPVALLSSAAGAVNVLRYLNNFPAGESIDSVSSGIIAAEDETNESLHLFNPLYEEIAEVANAWIALTTDRTSKFYALRDDGVNVKFVTIGLDGSLLATSAAVSVSATPPHVIAVNADGTIMYHFREAATTIIKRWDLVNDVALTNLVSHVGVLCDDAFCLSDGKLVVLDNTNDQIVIYNTDGTQFAAWAFTVTSGTARMARGYTEGTAWVWNKAGIANSGETFTLVDLSDGSTVQTVTGKIFLSGCQQETATATPQRFGNSNSCGFFVTQVSLAPIPPIPPSPDADASGTPNWDNIAHTLLKRLRRSPVIMDNDINAYIRYDAFELSADVGIGLTEGQGENPIVILEWSDNSGRTWSNQHRLSAGLRGAWRTRLRWGRLGMARSRVYQITVADPVPWAFSDAFVTLERMKS